MFEPTAISQRSPFPQARRDSHIYPLSLNSFLLTEEIAKTTEMMRVLFSALSVASALRCKASEASISRLNKHKPVVISQPTRRNQFQRGAKGVQSVSEKQNIPVSF